MARLLSFLFTATWLAATALASVNSISAFPALNSLRACASDCYFGAWYIASILSCRPLYTPEDSCFCRSDLQVTAIRYVSTCAYSKCSGVQQDVSSATQVYKDYCSSAGFPGVPASAPAQTTAATTGQATAASAPTSNSNPTTSDTSATGKSSKGVVGGLSVGELVGICTGCISAVAAVIGTYFAWRRHQNNKYRY